MGVSRRENVGNPLQCDFLPFWWRWLSFLFTVATFKCGISHGTCVFMCPKQKQWLQSRELLKQFKCQPEALVHLILTGITSCHQVHNHKNLYLNSVHPQCSPKVSGLTSLRPFFDGHNDLPGLQCTKSACKMCIELERHQQNAYNVAYSVLGSALNPVVVCMLRKAGYTIVPI